MALYSDQGVVCRNYGQVRLSESNKFVAILSWVNFDRRVNSLVFIHVGHQMLQAEVLSLLVGAIERCANSIAHDLVILVIWNTAHLNHVQDRAASLDELSHNFCVSLRSCKDYVRNSCFGLWLVRRVIQVYKSFIHNKLDKFRFLFTNGADQGRI